MTSRKGKKVWTIGFYGSLSWSNFVDWGVTLCLGGIIALTTLQMGGVRPDSQALVLPLYLIALVLHGLWFLTQSEAKRFISHIPFLFLPFLIWAWLNVHWVSPAPWRGAHELIYFSGAWIFLWIAVNNVRSRGQLWVIALLGVAPVVGSILNAYYQFFQNPGSLFDRAIPYAIVLDRDFIGRATGVFADPDSFAAYSLILLPFVMVGASVRRLPAIVRIFALYLVLGLILGIALAQSVWALALVFVVGLLVPQFCFKKKRSRSWSVLFWWFVTLIIYGVTYILSSSFRESVSPEAWETSRFSLWTEGFLVALNSPFWGLGGGAFSMVMEHSESLALKSLPETAHNDFLLIFAQYGVVGFVLLAAPIVYVAIRAYRRWKEERFSKKSLKQKQKIMPLPKFFLSLGICGFCVYGFVSFFFFPLYVPALLLLGVLLFAILVKHGFAREVATPSIPGFGFLYFALCGLVGYSFTEYGRPVLESKALEIRAHQELEYIAADRFVLAGNSELLDEVIVLYEGAIEYNPENADAWLGFGNALYQKHFLDPAAFEATSALVLERLERAKAIAPDYWRVTAGIGLAHALGGDADKARIELKRAVEMAPNSSNANYYYASFLSLIADGRGDAIRYVSKALEVDPENAAAQQLLQRLSIL